MGTETAHEPPTSSTLRRDARSSKTNGERRSFIKDGDRDGSQTEPLTSSTLGQDAGSSTTNGERHIIRNGDGDGSRATNSLKRAVYSGALSVAGYYERSVGLRKASALGRDTGSSKTNGILERIAQLNTQNPSIVKTYLCSAVDHYASTYGDRGWGCGYRNMQMVLSSLLKHPPYAALLGGAGERDCDCVPSIPRLQLLVERAWQLGFDTQVGATLAG
ncbi:zinc finger-containing ubiquitin peptidase 1-like [Ostrinia nubilalis]|uniref:zinc finger-containing ubiquitin peptidase 1-like n=1 Tax=Ostrinia nubilalis TaxID=29057 RepID=UPI0030822439